jgi:hypothetical protein
MTNNAPSAAWWKNLLVVGVAFGAAFALVLGAILWFQSRPKSWNTEAVKASYATLEFLMDSDSVVVEFGYDLQNNTNRDYRIDNSHLVVLARLPDGDALSRKFGHYQYSDPSVAPTFLPARGKTRIILSVPYEYPFDLTPTERQEIDKVSPSVGRRLKELNGFVIFDQSEHYQIDLPKGWKEPANVN